MSKRKKTYEFRFEGEEGKRRIYARFTDYFNSAQEVEVTEECYQELVLLNRSIRNIEYSEEYHKEYQDFDCEELAKFGAEVVASAEDTALANIQSEELYSALAQLSPIQSRRYYLVHIAGYTYEEICHMDGCSRDAVKHSLVLAKKNLKTILEKRLPITPSESGTK